MGACVSRIIFCLVGGCLKGSTSHDDLVHLRDGEGAWDSSSSGQGASPSGASGRLHHHHHHHHHHHIQGQEGTMLVQIPPPNACWPLAQTTAEEQLKLAKRISLIQRLPQGVIDDDSEITRECAICMVDYAKGDAVKYMPCIHMYHAQCIDDWLMRNLNCPSCMEPIDNEKYYTYESD